LANASDDVVSWNWSPPDFLSCTACASPVCTPNDPTTYTVLVTNANGCTASDTVFVRITCSEGAVHVPNAFTPNHDGRNDVFRPLGRAVKAIKHFAVYSRWGQCVYSVSNMSLASETLGWDGTFNGQPMPMGTYVYYLEIECFTGETYLVKGTVELIR
jgi:gliding motility-associated-like protein